MEPSRMDKVNKEIKKAISEILQFEARDERLKTFSISEVEVSKDLHFARIKVIERNNQEKILIKHLNNARVFIRKLLAERLNFLRYIPELLFEYDENQEKVAEVYKLMDKVEEERKEIGNCKWRFSRRSSRNSCK
jgi:ribosome-binding factor A